MSHPSDEAFLPEPEDEFEPGPTPPNEPVDALRKAILARVCHYFIPAGVAPDLIQPYAEELVADIEYGLDKFAKGQLKHGGNILDRDLLLDLFQEITDSGVYIRCMKLQRKCIRITVD